MGSDLQLTQKMEFLEAFFTSAIGMTAEFSRMGNIFPYFLDNIVTLQSHKNRI
jgi:hypothetical protein